MHSHESYWACACLRSDATESVRTVSLSWPARQLPATARFLRQAKCFKTLIGSVTWQTSGLRVHGMSMHRATLGFFQSRDARQVSHRLFRDISQDDR